MQGHNACPPLLTSPWRGHREILVPQGELGLDKGEEKALLSRKWLRLLKS